MSQPASGRSSSSMKTTTPSTDASSSARLRAAAMPGVRFQDVADTGRPGSGPVTTSRAPPAGSLSTTSTLRPRVGSTRAPGGGDLLEEQRQEPAQVVVATVGQDRDADIDHGARTSSGSGGGGSLPGAGAPGPGEGEKVAPVRPASEWIDCLRADSGSPIVTPMPDSVERVESPRVVRRTARDDQPLREDAGGRDPGPARCRAALLQLAHGNARALRRLPRALARDADGRTPARGPAVRRR